MLRAFAPDHTSRGHGQPPWISVQLGHLAVMCQVTGPASRGAGPSNAITHSELLPPLSSFSLCMEHPLCTRPCPTSPGHRAPSGLMGACPRGQCVSKGG